MAYIHFTTRTPCGFLIVPAQADPEDDTQTVLIQTDWDFCGIAAHMGWVPCLKCNAEGDGSTDGTVDCIHRTAGDMISEARTWIEDRAEQEFEDLDEYLPQAEPVDPEPDPGADYEVEMQSGPTNEPLMIQFVWTSKAGKKLRKSVPYSEAEAFMLSRWKRRERTTAFITDAGTVGKITHVSKWKWDYWWNPSNATMERRYEVKT